MSAENPTQKSFRPGVASRIWLNLKVSQDFESRVLAPKGVLGVSFGENISSSVSEKGNFTIAGILRNTLISVPSLASFFVCLFGLPGNAPTLKKITSNP